MQSGPILVIDGAEKIMLESPHSKLLLRRYAAMCGRLPVGKGFLDSDAMLVDAAMCSAC